MTVRCALCYCNNRCANSQGQVAIISIIFTSRIMYCIIKLKRGRNLNIHASHRVFINLGNNGTFMGLSDQSCFLICTLNNVQRIRSKTLCSAINSGNYWQLRCEDHHRSVRKQQWWLLKRLAELLSRSEEHTSELQSQSAELLSKWQNYTRQIRPTCNLQLWHLGGPLWPACGLDLA